MVEGNRIHTPVIFMLTVCIVVGGWFLTTGILKKQQEKFLHTTGRIEVGTAESALLTDSERDTVQEQEVEESEFHGQVMSEELRAIVLSVWRYGGSETLHEPLPGQMNMEQAIDAGQKWIQNMAEHGVYTDKLQASESDRVKASLCTLDTQLIVSNVEESMYSYWKIWVRKENGVSIELTIHAQSGEVWMADITVETGDEPSETYDLAYLLQYAFPFMETGDTMWMDRENKVVAESSKNGMVTAMARRYMLMVSGEPEKVVMEFKLQ